MRTSSFEDRGLQPLSSIEDIKIYMKKIGLSFPTSLIGWKCEEGNVLALRKKKNNGMGTFYHHQL